MSTGREGNRGDPNRAELNRIDLLQGTLDMLILRTLLLAPAHGHTIAHAIERGSEEVLQVEHGSLYPALHRLVRQGLLSAKDGLSENNRKAKYYSLTAKGRKRLIAESSKWDRLSQAIGRIMRPVEEEGQP
jgi:PadR family transcriptional regulator PadR